MGKRVEIKKQDWKKKENEQSKNLEHKENKRNHKIGDLEKVPIIPQIVLLGTKTCKI